jgi:hypothetical protein
MFEVACDWNYAAAGICAESAFIFARTARTTHFFLRALPDRGRSRSHICRSCTGRNLLESAFLLPAKK